MSEKHVVVVNGIILNKEKFLTLKRKESTSIHANKWCFPGGRVEKGEDLTDALVREISEETGILIDGKKMFINDYTYKRRDGTSTIGICFLVHTDKDEVVISEEFSEYKWVTKEEFQELDHIEELSKEVAIAFAQ